jgi:hypothetical protein
MNGRSQPVFIGAVCVGKTTVSKLVAAQIGRPKVELDEVAMPYYEDCPEFDLREYNRLLEKAGFVAAYRYWEPASVYALEGIVNDHPGAVLDLGAGHTSFLDNRLHPRISAALATYEHVILLLPDPDPERSAAVIRHRLLKGENREGTEWIHDGVDFVQHWVLSDQNRRLATSTIYTGEDPPDTVAMRVIELLVGSKS